MSPGGERHLLASFEILFSPFPFLPLMGSRTGIILKGKMKEDDERGGRIGGDASLRDGSDGG